MLLIECPYCGPRASPNSPAAARPTSRARCIPNNSPTVNGATTCSCAGIPWPASRAVGARAGLSPLVLLRDTVSYQILGYETFAPGASAAGADAAGQEVRNETGRPTGGRGRIDRSQPLHFTFNGVAYQGYPGDTLASALLANGLRFVARSFASPPARHRRGGWRSPTPSCSSKPGHTACRMRAPPRSSCTRPGGVQRECGTVAGARPPGHQPAAGALPARRLLLQDLHVAAPPVAPLRGQDPRGRRPGQRAGCPRCRALRQALRPLRCAGVGRRTGGIGGRRRGSRDRRARDPGGRTARAGRQPVVPARPRSTASRHCAGPGASRRPAAAA